MPPPLKPVYQEKIANLQKLIGQTPMVSIRYRYKGGPELQVLAKCEHFNMTGSIKDRMALYILQKAYEQGKIKPNDLIVEATSGNSGISFAAIGRVLGHRVKILMPDWMSRERYDLIKSYGAEVQLVSREQGGFVGSKQMAEAMSHYDNVFLPRQFENLYNVEAHQETTGREIGYQLLLKKMKPQAFVAGVGTGGTVMGVGKYLRILFPDMQVHPLEPAESPTMTVGRKVGSHRIQGISDEFIPEIVKLETLGKIVQVNDGDAILMAQKVARHLQLGVGISSGANLLGAIKVQQHLGADSIVITVFADSNKKYMSTDLFKTEPLKPGYWSPDIELLSYEVFDK